MTKDKFALLEASSDTSLFQAAVWAALSEPHGLLMHASHQRNLATAMEAHAREIGATATEACSGLQWFRLDDGCREQMREWEPELPAHQADQFEAAVLDRVCPKLAVVLCDLIDQIEEMENDHAKS
jgi:hypothetical protein